MCIVIYMSYTNFCIITYPKNVSLTSQTIYSKNVFVLKNAFCAIFKILIVLGFHGQKISFQA